MQTEAIFENINKRIKQEIQEAEYSIYVAVAWFTDDVLFHELEKKVKEGCTVSIITSDDFINKQSRIDYDYYRSENFQILLYGNSNKDLIHHKFCVIDEKTVISGSYNWTRKAKTNSENIVITKGDDELAKQFINEFNKLHNQFNKDDKIIDYRIDLDKIIRRLEIIKNFIFLEDIESIDNVSKKLNQYYSNKELKSIVKSIKNKNYSLTINQIQDFINNHKNENLIIWVDEEVVALKLELKNLEIQLNAYSNEKIEIEKQLLDFQHRHSIELGDIMSKILHFRKIKYKNNKKKFKEAEKDEEQYNEQIKEDKEKKHYDLNDAQKKELKVKFRKASILCHPDKVNDEMKDEAEKMFIELKESYDNNNLEKVSEILNSLEIQNFFKSKSETVTENEKLKLAIQKTRSQIKIILDNIIEIKENETFKTITSIQSLDEYFNNLKSELKSELESLENEAV
ncbi:phospholipase D-like domain-containing protein [Polaribacter sp. IC073]|uniref:phospholipase D-like domain-containing protein n=1 Tax=Polaribacter sp. IC073 TaxID=2508540 RepID=UPI0011BDAB7E|nr:phospholipase D-like domain-containing protein [Polaribacter sp. IC073]TXD49196.1 DUF1669 domain-containing protein [Polaribacter sp. IC073]